MFIAARPEEHSLLPRTDFFPGRLIISPDQNQTKTGKLLIPKITLYGQSTSLITSKEFRQTAADEALLSLLTCKFLLRQLERDEFDLLRLMMLPLPRKEATITKLGGLDATVLQTILGMAAAFDRIKKISSLSQKNSAMVSRSHFGASMLTRTDNEIASLNNNQDREEKRAQYIQEKYIAPLRNQEIAEEALRATEAFCQKFIQFAHRTNENRDVLRSAVILQNNGVAFLQLDPVVGIIGQASSEDAVHMVQEIKGKNFYSDTKKETGNPNALALFLNMYDMMQLVDVRALAPEIAEYFVDLQPLEELRKKRAELLKKIKDANQDDPQKVGYEQLLAANRDALKDILSKDGEKIKRATNEFRRRCQAIHWRLPVKQDAQIDGNPVPPYVFSTNANGQRVIQFIVLDFDPRVREIIHLSKRGLPNEEHEQRKDPFVFATSANEHDKPELTTFDGMQQLQQKLKEQAIHVPAIPLDGEQSQVRGSYAANDGKLLFREGNQDPAMTNAVLNTELNNGSAAKAKFPLIHVDPKTLELFNGKILAKDRMLAETLYADVAKVYENIPNLSPEQKIDQIGQILTTLFVYKNQEKGAI